jgi:hypothetical protein
MPNLTHLRRIHPGALVAGIGLVFLVVGANSCFNRSRKASSSSSAIIYSNQPAKVSVTRPIPTLLPSPRITNVTTIGTSAPPATSLVARVSEIYSAHFAGPPMTNSSFAPYGRLIRCQLVNSVETIQIETPIIGLVTHEVWHQGKLIVPVGTEVHGRARADRTRDRLAAQEQWRLVFHDGTELAVTGIALDQDAAPDETHWGLTDGSAGLTGEKIKSDAFAEGKLFLATALSGLAQGFRPTFSTPFGIQTSGSFRNAGLSGASAVMDSYAEQVLAAIKRDGLFVRIPAGKQFYLYTTQRIVSP